MEYRTVEQWSFEEAYAEQQEFSKERPGYLGPIRRWMAFRELERLEAEYRTQNRGFAVLAAVRKCANHDLVMPAWLAKAFIARYDKVLNCHVGSWDKAFDPPYKKGVHMNAMRKQRNLQFAVLNEVNEIRSAEPHTAIDKGIFERVGNKLGLGGTLAEKYYYSAQRLNAQLDGQPSERHVRNSKYRKSSKI